MDYNLWPFANIFLFSLPVLRLSSIDKRVQNVHLSREDEEENDDEEEKEDEKKISSL